MVMRNSTHKVMQLHGFYVYFIQYSWCTFNNKLKSSVINKAIVAAVTHHKRTMFPRKPRLNG